MIEGGEKAKKKRRHIVGLLVEDQPGVMAKISGLFSRRGFNIDTLVVGKGMQEGVSHIVVSSIADDKTIEQLEKQVSKLVDVFKVIDLNEKHSVVREHCLLKVSSTPKTRNDLVNTAKLHHAEVISMNSDSLIIEIIGTPEKIDNFLKLAKKYGVKEVSRTGINAMQRGNNKK
ncbi:MAG: acetolactate synthase small subunit [Candidatus Diapherotrites archaeon]